MLTDTAHLRQHLDHVAVAKLRMNRPLTASDLAELERLLAESGAVAPEDVARAVCYLASAPYVTGEVLFVGAAECHGWIAEAAVSALFDRVAPVIEHLVAPTPDPVPSLTRVAPAPPTPAAAPPAPQCGR